MISFNQYQDSRQLIKAFCGQEKDQSVFYGISFRMYLDARNTAESYEIQRYAQEGTNCPYFINWSRPEGRKEWYE
tara:strand:- start:89 stop:313 length:225 start_codon:yes stop_codon:yes gene_type:complete